LKSADFCDGSKNLWALLMHQIFFAPKNGSDVILISSLVIVEMMARCC
jgi:hypothetical protein